MNTRLKDRLIRWGVPLWLGALVLLAPKVWENAYLKPELAELPPLTLPWTLDNRHGLPVELSETEQEVLSGSAWISRGYWRETPDENRIIWINRTRSGDIARLHNYYDSLIASGARPVIEGMLEIPVPGGSLRATHITYHTSSGQPARMLFWYEGDGASAPDRWRWYGLVLKARLRGESPVWQLTEVAIRQSGDVEADLHQLTRFVQALPSESRTNP